jgi:uncharacterized protein YndB with AHSA1/START domain
MVFKVLAAAVLLAVAFIVIVATQPSTCRIVRTAVVAAPAATVYAEVNDFHRWRSWSPYENLDPGMTRTFSGPIAGEGAAYAWSGDRRVGEGQSTIVESRPNDLIRMKLEMRRPFACMNEVEFAFRPTGDGTAVTWAMTGEAGFLAKAMGLVFSMDKRVGRQFEAGLARLKVVAESRTMMKAATFTQN